MNKTHKPYREVRRVGFNHSIKLTLLLWFMLLALLPMSIASLLGYQIASKSLWVAAASKLEQVSLSDRRFIQNWFDSRFKDILQGADDLHTKHLLDQLKTGWQQSGKPLAEYVKSYHWAQLVDQHQEDMVTMMKHYDYINDLFLIDLNGNIIWSVEQASDLGNNLFTGVLQNTFFSQSIKTSLQTGQTLISDLERYSPSNNRLSQFISTPILDDSGKKIGLFAMQFELERIISELKSNMQSYDSLRHYIVGSDGLLRTEIGQGLDEVLNRLITTEQFNLWKHEHDDMHEVAFEYVGPDGESVIGIHHAIRLAGVNWVLISEVNRNEALASAFWLKQMILAILAITGLIVTGLATFQARRMSRPLIELVRATRALESGDLTQVVAVKGNNEIGVLAESFNAMLKSRQLQLKQLENSNEAAKLALAELTEQKFALDQHAIVSITNVKGDITLINEKFCEISGYSHEELIGQNHRMLKSGCHDKDFFHDMYHTIANGDVWHGEICNKAKDGHLYWVESTIVPFKDNNDKPLSYVAIRTDISERKQAELALYQAKENAEIANKAKSEFLANMSHEIRTPMNGIIGMTELLLDNTLEHDQEIRALTIKRSADSLLTIINDILDFSKIEAGKLDLELLDFDLGTLLEEIADTFALRAKESGLELICSVNPTIPQWYKGDPGRIRQILTNLVGNAIKFTEKGEVSVRYELITTENKGKLLRFAVNDTGIGLSMAQQQKLFQKFSQADGSTTRRFGGTGLGLAISKQLVELMGGEIGVDSELDQGSSFWFTLNLDQVEAKSRSLKTHDLRDEKVLVVDDNATNRQVFDELLNAWHVPHDLAESGVAALEAMNDAVVNKNPYTIAMIDMQMPEMDGAQLGEIIRGNQQLSLTHLALLTSKGRRGDARKMHKHGFAAYLTKPIHQSELYNALLQLAGLDQDTSSEPLITRYTAREQQPSFQAIALIVDDNTINQSVAEGLLAKFGIKVDIVNNGQEALDSLSTLSYDMVFMDCQMPVMDGYTATRHIRDPHSTVLNHSIPVIAMTANAMQGDREKCLASGMDDFISKPVDPIKLRKLLEKWLVSGDSNQECTSSEQKVDVDSKETEYPVFDFAAMSDRLMADKELIQVISDAYLNDMPEQIKQLKALVQNNDAEQAAAQAHKIKGASSNVGGMALSAVALKLEQAGKAGDIETVRQHVTMLEQCFKQLKSKMEETLS